MTTTDTHCLTTLRQSIDDWAAELGFQQVGVTDVDLSQHEPYLQRWLAAGHHGSMGWMTHHGNKRSRPDDLVPGTIRVLSLRMDYQCESLPRLLPSKPAAAFASDRDNTDDALALRVLGDGNKAYISRYALGRDYHKLIRKRLAQLARRIEQEAGGGAYRAFVDSAPVLERALAEKAGLGWIAKNTMLINHEAGSWFFLGEIYTDLPLPPDTPQTLKHCGTCTACLEVCPTQAFLGPNELDARKCISYLTIEHGGSIDPQLRPLMGNRVFGCDDCQLVCPWNKFTRLTDQADFQARHGLDNSELAELFLWTEEEWLTRTEGSPLRRIGHERWLRNLAVGLGNAPTSAAVVSALESRANHESALVREHVEWALAQHEGRNLTP